MANIQAAIDPEVNQMRARFGLYGERSPIPKAEIRERAGGLHMLEWEIWMGRLGMEAVWMEIQTEISDAFQEAATP